MREQYSSSQKRFEAGLIKGKPCKLNRKQALQLRSRHYRHIIMGFAVPVKQTNYLSKTTQSFLPHLCQQISLKKCITGGDQNNLVVLICNYEASVVFIKENLQNQDELQYLNMSDQGSNGSGLMSGERKQEYSVEKKVSNYVPGECSGKWSGIEHMRYIAFIDFNKDKMRSREKRRSNKFYQEMADFIQTRNALQCRSHHQKLQEKYTIAPKIINVFKPIFDKTQYKQALDSLHYRKRQTSSEGSIKQESTEIAYKNAQTQTQLGGLNLDFIPINPNCILIQPRGYSYFPPIPPPMYYNQFYAAPYHEYTAYPQASSSRTTTPNNWQTRSFSYDFGTN